MTQTTNELTALEKLELAKRQEQDRRIADMRRLYCQGATDDQFREFFNKVMELKLNPYLNHITWRLQGGKSVVIITREGYAHIANRDPNFNGIESSVIYEGDKVTLKEGSYNIEFGPDRFTLNPGKLVGAYCNVYRKDRAYASSAYVNLDMVGKDTGPWSADPENMLLKVAECRAIKKAFQLDAGEEE